MAERTKLIQARARKHWTQEQAAGFAGVDVRSYRDRERGTAMPRPSSRQFLCDAFGVTAEDLGFDVEVTSSTAPHADLVAMVGADLTMRLMTIVFLPHRNYQAKQQEMISILEEDAIVNKESLTRREALRRVATLPLLTLGLNPSLPTVHLSRPAEEIINQCAAGITACWELSKGDDESDLHLAFKGVSAYLPTLKVVVSESARYRKEAASLAGQCALLQCLLGWHLQGLTEAIAYAEEAVTYSREAGDIPLLLSTLDYLAWAHYYSKHSKQALKVIMQAVPYLRNQKVPLSPHLQGGVYSTIALMQARNGQQGTEALHNAAERFFAQPETDDRFVYMDYTHADLVLNDGMVHYHQGDHGKAMDSLNQLIDPDTLALKLALPERSKIEGINTMALASLKAERKDMEITLHFLRAGMTGAVKLQSEQRYNEALLAYEIADAVWPRDKRVKELRDLVAHW